MRGFAVFVAVTGLACGRIGFSSDQSLDAASDTTSDSAAVCTQRFCDDFTDNSLSHWSGIDGTGSVTVSAMGRAGPALHAVAGMGVSVAAVHADVFMANEHDHWVRAYIFAPSDFTLDTEPVQLADGADAREIVFSIYDNSTDVHTHGLPADVAVATDMTAVPRDVWSCYEFHATIGVVAQIELYREGVLLDTANADTSTSSSTRLIVGITSKALGTTSELFIDDVVADLARIGCL